MIDIIVCFCDKDYQMIDHFLNNIKKLLNEDTKICTVLKANAYGHGSVEIAKFLESKNVFLNS